MVFLTLTVRIGDELLHLGVVGSIESSLISIMNDALKLWRREPIVGSEQWEISIIFPWNNIRHVMNTDDELRVLFQEYFDRRLREIELEMRPVPLSVEFPYNDECVAQLTWEGGSNENENETETVNVSVPDTEAENESEMDEDYEMDEETDGGSQVSLVDEEEETNVNEDDITGKNGSDGSDMATMWSSEEDADGITRMARYCSKNRWVPNEDGTIELKEGQIFGNAKEVREVVTKYAIQEGIQLKKMKNDLCRYTVKCSNELCDWWVHTSRLPDGVTFMVKSIRGGHHMCQRKPTNKDANAKWIASVLKSTIEANPSISRKILHNELMDRFAVKCDKQTIYRAKRAVLKTLRTDHVQSYSKVRKYANVVLTMNPGSTAKVMVDHSVGPVAKFERFFLCFQALQVGFTRGCRPLIGVDGCHLTNPFEGIMLYSGIFPIAFAVCEGESLSNWSWFLRLLKESLGWDDNNPICFMSDRQKGGLSALDKEWPVAGKRYCFRRMLTNFRTVFKSHAMNGKLWAAARAGNVADYNAALNALNEDSVEAYEWLIEEESVDKWARHAFDARIKSDHITNNMSECFNSWIKEERDKPILTLLEHLRRKVMVRFSQKRDAIDNMTYNISQYARSYLENMEKKARRLTVVHGRGMWYETIEGRERKILVNIEDKTCECGLWQVSGLPCKHVLAVLMYRKQLPDEYVHWYYTKEALEMTYTGSINPIPDESRWLDFESQNIEPPMKKPKIGRPRKIRRRAANEPPALSKTFFMRCTNCKTLGHNIRTCPAKGNQKQNKGKKLASTKQRTSSTYKTATPAPTPSSSTVHAPETIIMRMNMHGESSIHAMATDGPPQGQQSEPCSQMGSTSQI